MLAALFAARIVFNLETLILNQVSSFPRAHQIWIMSAINKCMDDTLL